jgi:hypothetical protein
VDNKWKGMGESVGRYGGRKKMVRLGRVIGEI